ncbi:hypothetical protein LXA43DRAFT_655623 [Ganoderma leucocontextum]|nr:hypothetical protein LXA43DRAFT_655623 [Ganoderma leucocontextum]
MSKRPTRYRLFVGAPSKRDLATSHESPPSWRTSTTTDVRNSVVDITLPTSTLEAANVRISTFYRHAIFEGSQNAEPEDASDEHASSEDVVQAITWAPTTQEGDSGLDSRVAAEDTFLQPSISVSRIRTTFDNGETQETGSYDYSDASSIANFPVFHFNLHNLCSIASLSRPVPAPQTQLSSKAVRKVNILAAVLEIEGPETIRIKKGREAGKEVTLLKLIVGDETGAICRLSAWREVAEDWAGLNPTVTTPQTKKGDIVFLENIQASWEPETDGDAGGVRVTCSASPHLRSRLEVCFRALPSISQDAQFRPDLRLGLSDAVVRKVASVVSWFEGMAGLS